MNIIMKQLRKHKKFIIFCTGGGIGAIINWLISFLFTSIFGIYYVVSYTLAQTVNITFNFLWNQNITFKVRSKAKTRFVKFAAVSLSTAALSIFLVYIIKEYVLDNLYKIMIFGHDLNYLVAIMLVTFIVAVINYILSKTWVFEAHKGKDGR